MLSIALVFAVICLSIEASAVPSISGDVSGLSAGNTLYVGGSGVGNYTTIQSAIDVANNGDTIFVYSGTYYESIIVNKKINLIGEYKNETIINGEYQDLIIKILSKNVSINGFTIKNSKGDNRDAGIKIYSDNVTISDCLIYKTRHGIILNSSIGSKIINCIIHTNGEGVFFDTCINCEIIDSEFCHNAIGMHIKMSQEIKIEKSFIHENGIGILVNNSENITISDSAICDNNNNQGGCFIFDSNNIKIYNSNIIHNGLAIRIDDSKTIVIDKCTFRFNAHNCVYLKRNALNVTVIRCDIYQNLRFGIYVNNGECIVKNNNMYDNWIDSCHVKQGVCNASFNWWGSKFGPWFNGVKLVDLMKGEKGSLKLIPWNPKPVTNSGADWTVEDVFTKTEINGYRDENIT
ncbi:MAG: right-handed parallel beta-helix repeat-containing protein, partial [Thermoplasmatales archaeon]|nr:right-handed parallel beta-helix repeat-containing protein [Thermoplasmatales archaeon]